MLLLISKILPILSIILQLNVAEPSGQISEHDRSTAATLPWSRYEVEEITDLLDGDCYTGNDASEDIFKSKSGRYSIVHLATHAVVDDKNPSYSKLTFNNNGDDTDDGILYVYELYNISLKADLAVLTSCKTGTGKLKHGEGTFSIARAFMYAGTPSIIMSLWDIDDRSTAEIIMDFYKHLLSGQSKTDALRNAKLTYLENADQLTANPVYWAGMVSLGDQKNISINKLNNNLIILALLTIPVILIIIYLRFRYQKVKLSREQIR